MEIFKEKRKKTISAEVITAREEYVVNANAVMHVAIEYM